MDDVYTLLVDGIIYEQRGEYLFGKDKAEENVRKHGIDFESASLVLFDPLARFEDASSNGEQREAAIGRAKGRSVFYVVHVTRSKNIIRIISARAVTARERKRYEESE